ncbi:uncharacterized protein LOC125178645 [Hyalella azteca]|uniref:Uncharacterized protein LOC125178645 n=1 Tax=Hyalella azteca TaxID=294128 RepID=A0A979FP44_HYAAZ|nr:uncharacterized protein LOC125178645 [Hyalella azteca]
MAPDIKVQFVPCTGDVVVLSLPWSDVRDIQALTHKVHAAAAVPPDTHVLVGRLDDAGVFRELGDDAPAPPDASLLALEAPALKSSAYFLAVVNVGTPQLVHPPTSIPPVLPFSLPLLRTLNYDQIYDAVLARLGALCPPPPEEVNGRPWWVWDDPQHQQERQARGYPEEEFVIWIT